MYIRKAPLLLLLLSFLFYVVHTLFMLHAEAILRNGETAHVEQCFTYIIAYLAGSNHDEWCIVHTHI